MSQEEMKKRAAREKMEQETPGDLGRPPQGSDAVRIGTPTTSGTVSANPDGTLTVSGTHTYTTPGIFLLYVRAVEGIQEASGYGQAMVQSAIGVQAVQVNTIHATAQVPFHGTVATITGANSASNTTGEDQLGGWHRCDPWNRDCQS